MLVGNAEIVVQQMERHGTARCAIFRVDVHRNTDALFGDQILSGDRAQHCAGMLDHRVAVIILDEPAQAVVLKLRGQRGHDGRSCSAKGIRRHHNARLPHLVGLRGAEELLAVRQLAVRELRLHPLRHIRCAGVDPAGGRGGAAFQSMKKNALRPDTLNRSTNARVQCDAVLGIDVIRRHRICHARGRENVVFDEMLPRLAGDSLHQRSGDKIKNLVKC